MPLFEVERSPASVVDAQITNLIGEPLLRVKSGSAPDQPHLIALDGKGVPVVVDLVSRLDVGSLVASLGKAGAAARLTRAQLAALYPDGGARFHHDVQAFFSSVPVRRLASGHPAARLVIVCQSAAPEAWDVIEFLRQPGMPVEVLRMEPLRGQDGRQFVDIAPLTRDDAPQVGPAVAERHLTQTSAKPQRAEPATQPQPAEPVTQPQAVASPALPSRRARRVVVESGGLSRAALRAATTASPTSAPQERLARPLRPAIPPREAAPEPLATPPVTPTPPVIPTPPVVQTSEVMSAPEAASAPEGASEHQPTTPVRPRFTPVTRPPALVRQRVRTPAAARPRTAQWFAPAPLPEDVEFTGVLAVGTEAADPLSWDTTALPVIATPAKPMPAVPVAATAAAKPMRTVPVVATAPAKPMPAVPVVATAPAKPMPAVPVVATAPAKPEVTLPPGVAPTSRRGARLLGA